MLMPRPVRVYRLTHIENLDVYLKRGGMYAPKHGPDDGLPYRTIHDTDIQNKRLVCPVTCGAGGTVHDYVPFYLGPRSPMLLRLHTGRVRGYADGQEPLVYLVTTVEDVMGAGLRFVFSDGHGVAAFTQWYDDPADLDKVDWDAAYARYWHDTLEDNDLQRRKQAEFLVHRYCPWELVREIGVLNSAVKERVLGIIAHHGARTPVSIRSEWYY